MTLFAADMDNTVIGLYCRASEGKSQTLKIVTDTYEAAGHAVNYLLSGDGEVFAVVTVNGIRVGIESQGDPNGRMIEADTIRRLISVEGCSIVLCATRTQGMTVEMIDAIAAEFDYHTLWKSTNFSPRLNHTLLNRLAAGEIITLIGALVSGELAGMLL